MTRSPSAYGSSLRAPVSIDCAPGRQQRGDAVTVVFATVVLVS